MMRAIGTIALCGTFMLGASAPAMAAPAPKAELKIVDATKGGPTKTAWLYCGPAGGTHRNAREACRLLDRVQGKPDKLNVSPKAACSQELKPHAVVVVGRWYGKSVHWAKVFPNACQMKAATGAVLAV
ncbi:SSI family serine proteinase inhibitor [Nonomuraea sp. NPDC002799]